jgi:hypothetical protein
MGTPMEQESDFIVSVMFSEQARTALALQPGPGKQYQAPDLLHLRHVQTGDFLRIEGTPGLWVVQQRVWHLMSDQTQMKLVLDGPIDQES